MDGVRLPYVPPYELLSFGEAYETRLLDRVRSLLLLDVTDHVCYVGPEKGQRQDHSQERSGLKVTGADRGGREPGSLDPRNHHHLSDSTVRFSPVIVYADQAN